MVFALLLALVQRALRRRGVVGADLVVHRHRLVASALLASQRGDFARLLARRVLHRVQHVVFVPRFVLAPVEDVALLLGDVVRPVRALGRAGSDVRRGEVAVGAVRHALRLGALGVRRVVRADLGVRRLRLVASPPAASAVRLGLLAVRGELDLLLARLHGVGEVTDRVGARDALCYIDLIGIALLRRPYCRRQQLPLLYFGRRSHHMSHRR